MHINTHLCTCTFLAQTAKQAVNQPSHVSQNSISKLTAALKARCSELWWGGTNRSQASSVPSPSLIVHPPNLETNPSLSVVSEKLSLKQFCWLTAEQSCAVVKCERTATEAWSCQSDCSVTNTVCHQRSLSLLKGGSNDHHLALSTSVCYDMIINIWVATYCMRPNLR